VINKMEKLGERGEYSVLIVVLLVGSMMVTFTTFLSYYFSSMSTVSANIEESFARKELTIDSTIWENQDGDMWSSYVPHSQNNDRIIDFGDKKFWIDIVEDRRTDSLNWYYQIYPISDNIIFTNGIPVNIEDDIDTDPNYMIHSNVDVAVVGGFWDRLIYVVTYGMVKRGELDTLSEEGHRAINVGDGDKLHLYVQDIEGRENVGGSTDTTHYRTGQDFIHYEYNGDNYEDVSTERGVAIKDTGYMDLVFTMNRKPIEVGSQVGFKSIVLGLFSFNIPEVPTPISAVITSIVWIMLSYAIYTLIKGLIPLV
jgi:hypothetical protein